MLVARSSAFGGKREWIDGHPHDLLEQLITGGKVNMVHVHSLHDIPDILPCRRRLEPVVERYRQYPELIFVLQEMERIGTVLAAAVCQQTIVCSFALVLRDNLKKFLFILLSERFLLRGFLDCTQ